MTITLTDRRALRATQPVSVGVGDRICSECGRVRVA